MAKMRLTGLEDVLKKLKAETDKIEGKTLKGLIRAGIIVRRDMEKTAPVIPVDLGNLRSSFFMVTSEGGIKITGGSFTGPEAAQIAAQHSAVISSVRTGKIVVSGPYVVLGFSANYAAKVHEAVNVKFQRPGSGAKFLESALDRNTKDILEVIRKEAML